MPQNYKIQLANFTGPIDLLLHLIRANEMDILDLDLHLITQQYVDAIAGEDIASLENAYYFLLMASTLLEIKSKSLLPDDRQAIESEEPTGEEMKADLVRRLQTYQSLKDIVAEFTQREHKQRQKLPSDTHGRLEQTLVYSLKDVSLYDLIIAFEDAIARAQPVGELSYEEEDLSVDEAFKDVTRLLKERNGEVNLKEVLDLHRGLPWLIVAFLAVLELISIEKVRFKKRRSGIVLNLVADADTTI
jgi:segregation and condensation protein A